MNNLYIEHRPALARLASWEAEFARVQSEGIDAERDQAAADQLQMDFEAEYLAPCLTSPMFATV